LNFKQSSFFLAFVLAAAGPAFADHIAAGSKVGDGDFISTEKSTQLGSLRNASFIRNSQMRIFKEGKVGITGKVAVQFYNFTENKTNSVAGMALIIGTDSGDHKETLADFSLKHGNTFGMHDDKDWDDGATSTVGVPEPGSPLLLLVGLVGLGMSVYLLHLLRIAV
jgi:hypothetical protein